MKLIRFDMNKSVFQQYILVQSQHPRHKNRGKYMINTSLFSSPSKGVFVQIQRFQIKFK